MKDNNQSQLKGLISLSLSFLIMSLMFTSDAAPAGVGRGKKIALIIGNGDYSYSPLRNPVNDARDMSDTLERLGFEAIVQTNLNYKEMHKAVDAFGEKLNEGADVALFYYAGHGMQISGKNYLIPIGASIRYEKEVRYHSVDAEYVLVEMESAGCRVNIVILDACRGNPFSRAFQATSEGLNTMKTPVGTIIAYSTGPGKKAEDGGGENGVYTAALIEKMVEPGKRIVDIFNGVRKIVRTQTGGLQIPWESTSLESPFYFLPPMGEAEPEIVQKRDDFDDPVEGFDIPETGNFAGVIEQPIEVEIQGHEPGEVWTEPVTGMEFAWVPGGCYEMGCGPWAENCQKDENPGHEVCVSGFWMSKYETTNAQFLAFIKDANDKGPPEQNWFRIRSEDLVSRIQKADGTFFVDPEDLQLPVTGISWYGAHAFAKWLAAKTGKDIRLPTEAEWEYAAREGGQPITYSGGNTAMMVAVVNSESSDCLIQQVGMKNANAFGIYDLSGNVWEWCMDIYHPNAYRKHGRMNPVMNLAKDNTAEGAVRVIRGGSYLYGEIHARNTNRGSNWIAGISGDLGFRVVMHPDKVMLSRDFTCMRKDHSHNRNRKSMEHN